MTSDPASMAIAGAALLVAGVVVARVARFFLAAIHDWGEQDRFERHERGEAGR